MSATKSRYSPARRVRKTQIENTIVSTVVVLLLTLLIFLIYNAWPTLVGIFRIMGVLG